MRLTVASLVLLVLAGCSTVHAPVSLPLPVPDARLTDQHFCGRGDARLGDNAIVAARRKENARACEAGRVASWNRFYGSLRAGR